eukprot:PhF_6_TR33454/c0_g1_i1/m.48797
MHDHDHHHHGGGCACLQRAAPLSQPIEEIAFMKSIQHAAANSDLDRVKRCIQRNVEDAKGQDEYGYTALHYAAKDGDTRMCEVLLNVEGFPVNSTTKGGASTALHRAAMMGHEDVVKLLLEHGADKGAKDAEGYTPFDKAKAKGFDIIAKL